MWKQIYDSLCCCCCSCPCFQNRGQEKNEGQGHSVGVGIIGATYANPTFSYDEGGGAPFKGKDVLQQPQRRQSDLQNNLSPADHSNEKEKHPLKNSLILSKILTHLPAHDLTTCRLVNHQWCYESSQILRRKGDPIWIQTVNLPYFVKIIKKSRDSPFSRFALNLTEDAGSSKIYFPKKSKFHQNHMEKPHSNHNQLKNQNNLISTTKHFLQALGPQVLMLIIQIYEVDLPFIIEHLTHAPNLQSLLFIILPEKEMAARSPPIYRGHGNTPSNTTTDDDDEDSFEHSRHRNFEIDSQFPAEAAIVARQKQIARAELKMGKFRGLLRLPKLTEVRFIKVQNKQPPIISPRVTGQIQFRNLTELDLKLDLGRCVAETLNSCSNSISIVDLKNIDFPSNFEDSLRAIFTAASATFQKVTHLFLGGVTDSQLKSVAGVCSHLKYLELELKTGVEDVTLFEILNRNAGSLESLMVSSNDPGGVFYFPIKMSKMKGIVLKMWKGPILVDSIVLNCPSLEKLDFENFNPDNIVVHSDHFKHETLERLGLLLNDGELMMYPKRKIKGLYKRLLPQFPNVKDFYSAAETDDILELIFNYINHHLDCIYLDCSMDISDASLTGIPIDTLEAIQVDQIHKLQCGCWVFKNVKDFRKSSYVGSLRHLTQFHASIEPGAQITNLSLHHGISDLKSLQVLRLHAKDFRWCLECIADNLPHLEKLYLKSKRLYHEDDLHYLRARLPLLDIEFIEDPIENMHYVPRLSIQD